MPNTTVPATAEGMPKFDRAAIMRDAWEIYRKRRGNARLTNPAQRRREMSICLRTAWAWAKQARADAMKSLAERAADRVQELTAELMRIDAQPWGMRSHRIEGARASIAAEISALQKVARQ